MSSTALTRPSFQGTTTNITNGNNQSLQSILNAIKPLVFKLDYKSPCLFKTDLGATNNTTFAANSEVKIKAGTQVRVGEILCSFTSDTTVDMTGVEAAGAGVDWSVYVRSNGTAFCSQNISLTTDSGFNVVRLGGFHVGHVPANAAVASGAVAFSTTNNVVGGDGVTASSGMVWTQTILNRIKCVNIHSFWDLEFMPANGEPRGMVYAGGGKWVGIYMLNANAGTTLRASIYESAQRLASDTYRPINPTTGSAYPDFNWWTAADILRKTGCDMMDESLFTSAMAGVLEATSLGGANETPLMSSVVDNRFTSYLGIHGATGVIWTWGTDSILRSTTGTANWKYNLTGGRGSQYMIWDDELARVLLGGNRVDGALSGSRCSAWATSPRFSNWDVGVRAACGHKA